MNFLKVCGILAGLAGLGELLVFEKRILPAGIFSLASKNIDYSNFEDTFEARFWQIFGMLLNLRLLRLFVLNQQALGSKKHLFSFVLFLIGLGKKHTIFLQKCFIIKCQKSNITILKDKKASLEHMFHN